VTEPSEGLLVAKTSAGAGGGGGGADVLLLPQMANRHGLVAGATGTGKTVSLQVLAEAFSSIGVPVFAADIKGDLSGVSQPGGGNEKVDARIEQLGIAPWDFHGAPVMFWDVFGEQGHPVRTTASEVGPLLLSRMLGLNDIQEASSPSPSASPTTTACCCSTWTTCAASSSTSQTMRTTSAPPTATSRPPRSALSSARC
jgi:hypothetical protein